MVVSSKWESGVAFETLPLDTLREAELSGRLLPGVDFQDADLTGASLSRANCDHARFRYADLRAARLDGAALRGATYSPATTWPAPFHAEASGAALVAGFDPDEHFRQSNVEDPAAPSVPHPIRIRDYATACYGRYPPEIARRLAVLALAATAALVAIRLRLR